MSIDTNGQDSSDPLIGQSIAEGRYRVVRVIGEGGMGKVYLGEQKLGDRTRSVAIKTLQPDLAQDPQIVARFHREAGTVSVLEHPNTIKFFESGELADGKLFVAMEFIQGESLAHVIGRGPLPGPRVEHILSQVCGSLQEAHEHGVVHRDLKPENIILTQKGAKGDFVKVLDFGIAKRDEAENQNDAKLTRQGMVLGTPPYMSPEQFTGQPLRQTSDIYSLAIVAYEMLTGRLPFNAATPWEWATKHLTAPPQPFEQQPNGMSVLPRHKAAVMRALGKDPATRPQTTLEFLAEFTGNREAGTDWAASSTSGQGAAHSSNQGQPSHPSMQGQPSQPGYFGAMPPTAMAPAMGGQGGPSAMPTGPGMAGQPGVNATVAVSYPTPQPFGSQQGYPPAPTNAGFAPVAPPPSNPGFNPTQGGGMYNPAYTSHPGNYGPPPQSSGGAGKFIAIGAVLLLLVGVGGFFALRKDDPNNNSNNNNYNSNNTANINSGNNGNTEPTPTPTPPDPVPTPPVPAMNPIPSPQPSMNPIPTPEPTPEPEPTPRPRVEPRPTPPSRPSTPSICGQRDRIDELILNGRCSAAQALYRRLRSSGCRVSNDSFGSACPAP